MECDASSDEPRPASRTAFGITAGALAVGVATMLGAVWDGSRSEGPPLPAGAASTAPAAVAAPPQRAAVPTWLTIPAIDVETPLMGVGLEPEGWLAAPPPGLEHLVGWYQGAVTPGERGTAVLVGHVDGAVGPAVFYDLGTLTPGDTVEVVREDGTRLRFTVHEVAVFDKEQIPARVYEDSGRAELRLITCGGSFEEGSGYQGNVVVFAHLTQAG
ncbi:class F sortase [Streptomyces sp. 4N509B]|uniref:class F sortase n=1 Tax=Streptomyces sp. 4N509B TaxID=3457413 RepID=UPI003FD1A260